MKKHDSPRRRFPLFYNNIRPAGAQRKYVGKVGFPELHFTTGRANTEAWKLLMLNGSKTA